MIQDMGGVNKFIITKICCKRVMDRRIRYKVIQYRKHAIIISEYEWKHTYMIQPWVWWCCHPLYGYHRYVYNSFEHGDTTGDTTGDINDKADETMTMTSHSNIGRGRCRWCIIMKKQPQICQKWGKFEIFTRDF